MVEHIDIDKVLRTRVPRYRKWMPRFVVRWLERLVHQDELNAVLDHIGERHGVEAAKAIIEHLDITLDVHGKENLPDGGRYLFVSNHPLGGLDGIALIAGIGAHYGGEIRFLVNDLLMAVKPLSDVFLPVNKYGRQKREAVEAIETEYAGNRQMLSFPAGLCSRRLDDGSIGDLPWQKNVVVMATRHRRDIVPIRFDAVNSNRFYRIARLRERLGIKFNFEMILLPAEVLKKRGQTLHIVVGKPIDFSTLDTRHPLDEAARLRKLVYKL